MTDQLALGFEAERRAARGRENASNLKRVATKLDAVILEFCRHIGAGQTFRGPQLTTFVMGRAGGVHDSPTRILRSLRQRGQLGYKVENRAQSLYRITWVSA
ncbi:MAG: hypothetical protein AAGE52_01565 [Myxococcota bacterium]